MISRGTLVTTDKHINLFMKNFFVGGEGSFAPAYMNRGEIGTVLDVVKFPTRVPEEPEVIVEILTSRGTGWIYEDWVIEV